MDGGALSRRETLSEYCRTMGRRSSQQSPRHGGQGSDQRDDAVLVLTVTQTVARNGNTSTTPVRATDHRERAIARLHLDEETLAVHEVSTTDASP